MEILKKFAFLDIFRASYGSKLLKIKHDERKPFFAMAFRFVTLFFFFFFRFSFFSCFCRFAALANCQLTANASCQAVERFSRKHHPKGKFLPSDEEGYFSCVFFTQIYKRFCIYLKLNITLLWVLLLVWFLFLQQVFYYCKRCLFHVNAW